MKDPKDNIDVLIPPKDEWDREKEINSEVLQNKEDWKKKKYEKRNDPEHPYCTNWPVSKKEKKDENI